MTTTKTLMTLAEFEAFIDQLEQDGATYEYIAGELFLVPTNQLASKIAARILIFIGMYLLKNNIGHLTGADHGYVIGSERYAPDVGYLSYARYPDTTTDWFTPTPPEFVVEVVSSDRADENKKLSVKVTNYMAAGAIVWVVRPQERHIEAHAPGQSVVIYRDNADVLTIESVLPGFEITVADVFAVMAGPQS